MALFKGLGWRHTRSFPFHVSTTTSPFTKPVGFWTGLMISKSTIRFNSFSNLGFKARGIFLTGVTTGVTLSLNLDKNCSSITFTTEIRFIRFRLSVVADNYKKRNIKMIFFML